MTTWQELLKYNFDSPPICQFKRKVEIEDRYKEHMEHLKRDNISIIDYIKGHAFPKNETHQFMKNTFPYDLDDHIDHWLLWINPDNPLDDVIIKELVKDNMGKDAIYFCNYKFNQSIPGIRHCHIFIKN